MAATAGRAYRWLLGRLPPGAAWWLWRTVRRVAGIRGRRVEGPLIALAAVAWGATPEQLRELIYRLVGSSGADPSLLLVVTDCDAVDVAARMGCRLEHVPPRTDWEPRFPGEDYEAFRARRLRAVRESYRIEAVDPSAGASDLS